MSTIDQVVHAETSMNNENILQNDDDIPNWLDLNQDHALHNPDLDPSSSEYHRYFVIHFHWLRKFQHAIQMTDSTNVKFHRMISIRRHYMLNDIAL